MIIGISLISFQARTMEQCKELVISIANRTMGYSYELRNYSKVDDQMLCLLSVGNCSVAGVGILPEYVVIVLRRRPLLYKFFPLTLKEIFSNSNQIQDMVIMWLYDEKLKFDLKNHIAALYVWSIKIVLGAFEIENGIRHFYDVIISWSMWRHRWRSLPSLVVLK